MTRNTAATRTILTIALIVGALGVQVSSASAYSSSVRSACMGDYFSYCSHTMPGSKKLTRCMRNAGPKLSNGCVKALVNAGMVSKSEVNRRSASK